MLNQEVAQSWLIKLKKHTALPQDSEHQSKTYYGVAKIFKLAVSNASDHSALVSIAKNRLVM